MSNQYDVKITRIHHLLSGLNGSLGFFLRGGEAGARRSKYRILEQQHTFFFFHFHFMGQNILSRLLFKADSLQRGNNENYITNFLLYYVHVSLFHLFSLEM